MTQKAVPEANQQTASEQTPDQKELWQGPMGDSWIAVEETVNDMFAGLMDVLQKTVAARPDAHVLDVGCGTGGTSLAAARVLTDEGSCTGIDLSKPMLALARERAAQQNLSARFIVGDAQDYAFEPGGYDLLISRFGVMFFSDSQAAFENLRRAVSDTGALCFLAWRGLAENPFMALAHEAAAPFFPDMPERQENEPGPFNFADGARAQKFLEGAGWAGIDIAPLDMECRFAASELTSFLTHLGPLGAYLKKVGGTPSAEVIEAINSAYAPFVVGDEIVYNAACWKITARA